MSKLAIIVALSLSFFAAVAGADRLATEESATIRNMPVIVKNEAVAPGLCRLHFDDATSREVTCTQPVQD